MRKSVFKLKFIANFSQFLKSAALVGPFCLSVFAPSIALAAPDTTLFDYQDVFNLEYASGFTLSPDNQTLVFERRSMDVHSDRTRINLWQIDLASGAMSPLLSGESQFYAPRFSPDGSRLLFLSNQDGKTQIYVHYIAQGRTARLTDMDISPANVVWSPDASQIAFTAFVEKKSKPLFVLPPSPAGATWAGQAKQVERIQYRADGGGFIPKGERQIFVLPATGGTPRQLTYDTQRLVGNMRWSLEGDALYFSAIRTEEPAMTPRESDVYRLDLDSLTISQLTQRVGPDVLMDISPTTGQLAVLGYEDERLSYQNSNLTIMAGDGTGARRLLTSLDRPIGRIQWSANGLGLYYSYTDHGRGIVSYVTTADVSRQLTDKMGGTTLGRPYGSGSFIATGDGRVIFTESRTDRPGDASIIDRVGNVTRLTDLNSDILGHKEMSRVEAITMSSSHDGLPLEAWVAYPPNFDPNGSYPLLLEIHGGPHAPYGPQFSAEVQLYAAAGYVVVYGNPRGSTSYGQDFANEIHHNYPSHDYNDLMDMVDAVTAKGFIDERRLFVTGGSGGGVLTAWIVGKTNRFRAAVVAKPVINWASFALTADGAPMYSQYWFPAMPWEDPLHYWNRSPLSLVGTVETPTMLLTGEMDYRTPMSETEQYYQALKLRGIDSMMIRIPGASHGIAARPSNLVQKVGNILAWFERYDVQN